jgi:hypothetical protein
MQPRPKAFKKLDLALINARSIVSKMHALHSFISVHASDIILITESWCTNDTVNISLTLPNYQLFRKDRDAGRGGGCLIYVSKRLFAQNFEHPLLTALPDSLWITVSGDVQLLVGCIYRAPGCVRSTTGSIQEAFNCVSNLGFKYKLIAGDLNMPDIIWNKPSASMNIDFLTTVQVGGWKQLVHSPTRVNKVLDLVFTLNIPYASAIVDQEFPGSDHKVVLCSINVPCAEENKKSKQKNSLALINIQNPKTTFAMSSYGSLQNVNWNLFESLLRQLDWDEFFLANEVDVAVDCFLRNVLHCMLASSSSDVRLDRSRNLGKNAETRAIVKAKKMKSAYRKTRDFSAILRLATYSATITEQRKLKRIKEEKYALGSSQKTGALALLLKRRNLKCGNKINHITKLDGTVVEGSESISEAFSAYFASVYTTEGYSHSLPTFIQQTSDSLGRISVELNVVKSLVRNIRSSNMPGPDGVPPVVILKGGSDISLLLFNIYNLSFNTGVFPSQWKTSVIIPRHKGGPIDEVKSYRPINHTPIVSRTLERIVKKFLIEYIEKNQLIGSSQHGFLSKRSCMTCHVDFLNKVTSATDSGDAIIIILLDMQKAFDRVPHSHMLAKLQSIGICNPLLSWFSSFLKDRKQTVCIEDSYSTPRVITSGVVQGSVLGPLLFLIYINDICDVIRHGHPFLFADDIKLVYTFRPNNLHETLRNIQMDLDSLAELSNIRKIRFSSTKSNVLTYKCLVPCDSILIAGERITVQNSVRDLGIRYSSSFNFSEHVSFQLAKARQSFGLIKKSFILPMARLNLYKTHVRPLLEYCSIIFGNMRKQDRLALETFQRAVTKSVVGYSSNLTYRERCQQLSLQPLWLRRLLLNMNFLHGLVYGRAYSANGSICFQQNSAYYLRNKSNTLPVFKARTKLRAGFYLVKYSSLWNMLPSNIREVSSPSLFKKRLQEFLNPCRILELFRANLTEDKLFEVGPDSI